MDAIVCTGSHWGIGYQGDLLFHISADLKRFRSLTLGKTVVMGRHTLDSLPGGRPLPERRNVVLSRKPVPKEGVIWAKSIEEAWYLSGEDAVVIGGAKVYEELLPYCQRVRLTMVDAAPEADCFFPNLFSCPQWRVISESETIKENGLCFRYIDFCRLVV